MQQEGVIDMEQCNLTDKEKLRLGYFDNACLYALARVKNASKDVQEKMLPK